MGLIKVICPSIPLYDDNNTPISPDQLQSKIEQAFIELADLDPHKIPIQKYIECNKRVVIGLHSTDNKHLTPIFNFEYVTSLKCEFTHILRRNNIKVKQSSVRNVRK